MGHDGTALEAGDYETAALPLSYAGIFRLIIAKKWRQG